MHITLATTGGTVVIGRLIQAVAGPYAGSWWRLDDVREADGGHLVCASRPHRIGRHRITAPAEVFGLIVQEAVAWSRHVINILCDIRRKVDDGILLGFLALIPLALFEAFHGGEATRQLLESLFGPTEGGH
jgi:hypothetical protein